MSNASANSSKASREVKLSNLRSVGGPLSIVEKDKEYSIEMNPEYIIDFSTPMMELEKSVGTYSKVVDDNGNIIRRVDDKTGAVLDKSNKDVTIVAIDDEKIRKAKTELDKKKVSKSSRDNR